MKVIFFLLLLLSQSLWAHAPRTPLELKDKEAFYTKWSKKVGEKELTEISRMNQWPKKAEVLFVLYPYLLPESFKGKSFSMECYLSLNKVMNTKKESELKNWKSCWKKLYGGSLPSKFKDTIDSFRVK